MNDYFKPGYSRWFYSPKAFFENIILTFRWMKWSWQRAFRGYADCDYWSIDYYFYVTIVPLLKILRKNRHGYPTNITDEKWDSILGKIIEAFEAANRVVDLEYENNIVEEMKKDESIFFKDGKLFIKHFFGLWD